jgi:flagellar biogenesis protein FliO
MTPHFSSMGTDPIDPSRHSYGERPAQFGVRVTRGSWLGTMTALFVAAVILSFPPAILAGPPGEPSILRQHAVRTGESSERSRQEGAPIPANPRLPSEVFPASGTSIPARSAGDGPVRSGSPFEVGYAEPQPVANTRTVTSQPSQAIELKPPSQSETAKPRATGAKSGSMSTMLLALGFVVGLFLVANQVVRKAQPKRFQKLPGEVVEVLGRTSMGQRQQLVVMRFGSKLILVSQQAGETQTLAEIIEPTEVERLQALCLGRAEPISSAPKKESVFSSIFNSLT